MELLERLNTIATVKENEEVKGIEVYFDTKPEYNIITELKNNKFRWHNVKKCWYIKKSMLNGTTKKEVKEVKEMKEFTKVVGEELKELAKKLWDSESMQDFIIDKYDFYKTKDGLIIELEKVNKITIDKTIWYDDETEAPEKTETFFINYNMSNEPSRSLSNYLEEAERLKTNGCASGRYDYQGIYFVEHYTKNSEVVSCNWFDEKDKYFKRYLTNEEQQEFIELMEDRKQQYIERLKTYFKRYNKHIHVSGYWANR
jgi:hypothetical protein